MKTKIQILKWMLALVLLLRASGAWAQTTVGSDHACVGATREYWADYPTPSPNSTYTWTVDGGEVIESGQGTYHITILWNTANTYNITVTETDKTTLCSAAPVLLQVIVDPLPTIAAAGSDQSVCGTLAATLAGNTPTVGTGTWTFVSGPGTIAFSDANSATSTATASVYGTYVIRWTIANGTCTPSTDDVTVDYLQTPTIAAAGSDQSVCGTLAA
ncbi:MAG: hypothetical protein WCI92_09180, partial [Bacteroidota bacterium]